MNIAIAIIQFAQSEMQEGISRIIGMIPQASAELKGSLYDDLCRVLAEEFSPLFSSDYARISDTISFEEFVASLSDHRMKSAVYDRYPLLERHLQTVIESWVGASQEVMNALFVDLSELRLLRFVGTGTPNNYTSGLGDYHCNRRSVSSVTFDDGGKLLFKPRSDELDRAFERILNIINPQEAAQIFIPRTLSRGQFHWQEYVQARELNSPDEAAEYYDSVGFLVGTLGLLHGTDVHRENVISCGRCLAVVDLETLFHPRWTMVPSEDEDLIDTVLRSGLLPVQLELNDHGNYVNKIGLRSKGDGQGSKGQAEDSQTESGLLQYASCMPTYRGKSIGYGDYVENILCGVRKACEGAIARRHALLCEIRLLKGKNQRFIYQHTKLYTSLLKDLRDPYFFRSEDRANKFLSDLTPEDVSEGTVRFALAEKHDILKLDIPIFTSSIGGSEIQHVNTGITVIFNAYNSLSSVEYLVRNLDEETIKKLTFFIRGVLNSTKNIEGQSALSDSNPDKVSGSAPRLPLKPADQVTDEIVCRALNRFCTKFADTVYDPYGKPDWILIRSAKLDNSVIEFGRPDLNLHYGKIGEALALKVCDNLLGRESDLTCSIIKSVRFGVEHDLCPWEKLGIMNGLGGLIYGHITLERLGDTTSMGVLKERIANEDVRKAILSDCDLTLGAGTAGLMAALSDLYRCHREPWMLNLALECQEKLGTTLTDQGSLFGWIKNYPKPLTGLAHGLSGYAVAYSKLYLATNEICWLELATKCFTAEDAHFDSVVGNWPDFRQNPPGFAISWAHGAPGIGLARLIAIECGMPAELHERSIEKAVQTTLKYQNFDERGLTTSSLGNAAFIARFKMSGLESSDQLAIECDDYINKSKYHLVRYIESLRIEYPLFKGFFSGISGEIFQLCALHWPGEVPPLLAFDSCYSDI